MEDGKPIRGPNRSNAYATPIAQPDNSLRRIGYRYIFPVHRSSLCKEVSLFQAYYQHLPQLKQTVIRNDRQSGAGERDVDGAPGANDQMGALLAVQGTGQASAFAQEDPDALEIVRLGSGQGRRGCRRRGSLQSLGAILFERSGLPGAQPFDRQGEFVQALLYCACDADPIDLGFVRDDPRLPEVEQATDHAAENQQEQRIEGRGAKGSFGETFGEKREVVRNILEVLVQASDEDAEHAEPDMQPEPVLHLARQRAHKTPAQGIGRYQEHQRKGHHAKLAPGIVAGARVLLGHAGRAVDQSDTPQEKQGAGQEEPVIDRPGCFPDAPGTPRFHRRLACHCHWHLLPYRPSRIRGLRDLWWPATARPPYAWRIATGFLRSSQRISRAGRAGLHLSDTPAHMPGRDTLRRGRT